VCARCAATAKTTQVQRTEPYALLVCNIALQVPRLTIAFAENSMRMRPLFVAVTLCIACGLPAQSATPNVAPAASTARRTVFTINPFAVFGEYFAGDVETRLSKAFTLGPGFSFTTALDRSTYFAVEAKARYYPAESALEGLAVAATVGVATASRDDNIFYADDFIEFQPNGPAARRSRVTKPTFGTELSYQWIVGPSRRFVTVLGVGVKRFIGDVGFVDPISQQLIPTARVNIGYAF
jgi:hypothetical protein